MLNGTRLKLIAMQSGGVIIASRDPKINRGNDGANIENNNGLRYCFTSFFLMTSLFMMGFVVHMMVNGLVSAETEIF